jgi:hypothetical protein
MFAYHCESSARTPNRSVIGAMNHFPDCHRELKHTTSRSGSRAMNSFWIVMARTHKNAEPFRNRAMNPRGPREPLRGVTIQLDHHAWRSQARDDKSVFIGAKRRGQPSNVVRGLPQSPRLLRNDKRGFICRSAPMKQSGQLSRNALILGLAATSRSVRVVDGLQLHWASKLFLS